MLKALARDLSEARPRVKGVNKVNDIYTSDKTRFRQENYLVRFRKKHRGHNVTHIQLFVLSHVRVPPRLQW